MRRVGGPGSAGEIRSGGGGRSSLRVLLATEGSYPFGTGDVSDWCDSLVRGLPDLEFVLWAVAPSRLAEPRIALPSNVSEIVAAPLAGGVDRAGGDEGAAAVQTTERQVERLFLPLFSAFLGAITAEQQQPEEVAGLFAEMNFYFRDWSYDKTWRSRAVWDAFKDWLGGPVNEPRAGRSRGPALTPAEPASRWRHVREGFKYLLSREDSSGLIGPRSEVPTVGEAAQALDWLRRLLVPLAVPVPECDVVHAIGAGPACIPGVLAKIQRDTPFVLTEHGSWLRDRILQIEQDIPPYGVKRFLIDLAEAMARTGCCLADQVSPTSRAVAAWEEELGVPPERIRVIYSGVDELEFQPSPLGHQPVPTVATLCPIEPLAGLENLLRVAERVRDEIPEVRFVHHGPVADSKYWSRLRAMHRDLRLGETVQFLGPTGPAAALSGSDLLLLTFVESAFPLAVVQALMTGTPAVATSAGGVGEAISGIGITARPDDVDELARGVITILRLPVDERLRISAAARARALERFTLSRFLAEYRETYESLAHGPHAETRAGEERAEPEHPSSPSEPEPRSPSRYEVLQVPEISEPLSQAPSSEPEVTSDTRTPELAEPPEEEPVTAVEIGAEDLARALSDPDPFVRAEALGRARTEPGVGETIALALSDDYPQVRREAVRAMVAVGGVFAATALAGRATEDPSAEVREEAVTALALLLTRRAGNVEGP